MPHFNFGNNYKNDSLILIGGKIHKPKHNGRISLS